MKLGGGRVNTTAWYQVTGVAAAGAKVSVFPGSIHTPVSEAINVFPTLARGRIRIPYRLLGRLPAYALHDYIVSRRLGALVGKIDIIHTWPLGALRTLKVAAQLGIPTVLERPNAYTGFAFEVVQRECERLGVTMPEGHEHTYNPEVLRIEEEEYRLADRLLCPSDFVARTFLEQGFPREKLARHQYGYDDKIYHPLSEKPEAGSGLMVLFVGGCAPRKGLHYALQAWLQSPAHRNGIFQIAGAFIPGYAEKLATMLSDPSVRVLGHRSDIPELMRQSDILVLPSIEEGSALVTAEARGSGCVLLVSEAAGAICRPGEDALVHQVGDVDTLATHIRMLHEDRMLLKRLRAMSLKTLHEITWTAAGRRLLDVYRDTIALRSETRAPFYDVSVI
jgi:glycosyltransferase involved in cell wall biosynthesis